MAKRHEEMAREFFSVPRCSCRLPECTDPPELAALLARVERETLERAAALAEERPLDPKPFVMNGPRAIFDYLNRLAGRIRALLTEEG